MSDQASKLDLGRVLKALENARREIERLKSRPSAPIAVIGMACRYPGATNPVELWQLVEGAREVVAPSPEGRWNKAQVFDAVPQPGKAYVDRGGFLSNIEQFDEGFFNISPREAEKLDPQQRVLLETAWEALEDAGVVVDRLRGTKTGVFVGISNNEYSDLAQDGFRSLDSFSITGNSLNAAAGRLSYVFGFSGPALAVDTACSSSLVALHLACQSLSAGECEQAIAAGVNLILSPRGTIALSQSKVLSPSGRCRPFDARADGMVRAEGSGVLVLKPLPEALKHGDRILAVIRGSGVNQDGPSSGLTVPNGSAQASLMREVLAKSGLTPDEVDYIETHGTGTALGDPIELRALEEAYGKHRTGGRPLYLGALKANIGHSESASGVAGVIKAVLALQHGCIAKLPAFERPNDNFTWQGSPLHVPTENVAWPRGERTRRAAVSSFGFSGTNAHVILEEAPRGDATPNAEPSIRLFPLSARTHEELSQLALKHADALEASDASLTEFVYTAQVGRKSFPQRMVARAADRARLIADLRAFTHGATPVGLVTGEHAAANTVFLFSGQGSQAFGMGAELAQRCPPFARHFADALRAIDRELAEPLTDVLWQGEPTRLNQTRYTQPALFAFEYALAKTLLDLGVVPSALCGHSIGELSAACVAGVFDVNAGARLVCARARLMGSLPAGGGMLAVITDGGTLRGLLRDYPELDLAAENGPTQWTVAGPLAALERLRARCGEAKITSVVLRVSHAFHSRMMEPMLEELRSVAEQIAYSAPQIALFSTVSGQRMAGAPDAAYWVQQVARPVRFAAAIEALASAGFARFVEVGPGAALTGLARSTLGAGPACEAVVRQPSKEWESFEGFLASEFAAGSAIAWRALYDAPRSKCSLPSYPFARRRFWPVEAVASPAASSAELAYERTFVELPAPRAQAVDGRWLWVHPSAAALAAAAESGIRCLSESSATDADTRLSDLVRAVRDELAQGRVAGVVYSPPTALTHASEPDLTVHAASLVEVARLVSELAQRAEQNVRLVLLTERAVATTTSDVMRAPVGSPLLGLGNVVRSEHPALGCFNVDADDLARVLPALGTIVSHEREPVVIVRGSKHLAPRLIKRADVRSAVPSVRADAAYLVTGGLGGIGLAILGWLADLGARNLWVVGRSDANTPARQAALSELARRGVTVHVRGGGVSHDNLRGVLAELDASPHPLAGVFHLAGVAGGGLLENESVASTLPVLTAKLEGAFALHLLTQGRSLDYFVLASSLATSFPAPGQGAYAYANAFLDGLGAYRLAHGLPSLTVSFGEWEGVGMAVNAQHARRHESGVLGMSSDAALAALGDAMAAGVGQATIVRLDVTELLASKEAARSELFSSLGRARTPTLEPSTERARVLAAPARNRRRLLVELATQQIRRVARLSVERTLQGSTSFDELGFDSLMALELRNALREALSVPLPSTFLYDHPTLDALVDALSDALIASRDDEPAVRVETALKAPAQPRSDEIAIVGMACRFPGGIRSPEQLWSLLARGGDVIAPMGDRRWDMEHYFDRAPDAPGKMYSDRGGLLDDVECFDNTRFGVSDREAVYMDPQQRILLEVAWEALERAGQSFQDCQGGVFVGAAPNEYGTFFFEDDVARLNHHMLVGNAYSVLAGRLAYHLGWSGPALALDTACSSALAAVHLAAASLRRGECDVALAGGVNIMLLPSTNVMLCRARMLSPDGACKTFDASANGYVRAEGCGLVVLKRLEQARADGDRVLAVLRGSAMNQDGRSQGLTAPNVQAQISVMKQALTAAELTPSDVGYVEAHGTGTQLGDPIEVRGIDQVYGSGHSPDEPLRIGSIKTNLGHTEAAAGIAGLMKAVLMLQHKRFVPNVHLKTLSPHFGLPADPERCHLRFPTAASSWESATVRRAAVSSFGFSGTNVHAVLEESPAASNESTVEDVQLVTLSADGKGALARLSESYAAAVPASDASLADIAFTTGVGRQHLKQRRAFVVRSKTELCVALAREALVSSVHSADVSPKEAARVLYFARSGVDLRQVKALAGRFLPLSRALAQLDVELGRVSGGAAAVLSSTPTSGEASAAALLTAHVALARAWLALGFDADELVAAPGAELAAATVAGVFRFVDALRVAEALDGTRGQAHEQRREALRAAFEGVELKAAERVLRLRATATGSEPEVTQWLGLLLDDSPADVVPATGATVCEVLPAVSALAADNAEPDLLASCLSQLAMLYVAGFQLRFAELYEAGTRRKALLPTYPFERRAFWVQRDVSDAGLNGVHDADDVGDILSAL